MRFQNFLAATALALAAMTTSISAGGHAPNPAVLARQAHMTLYAHNVFYLLGVARGRAEYDADMASAAAQNILTLMDVNQGRYWEPGTDSGTLDYSNAKAELWQNFPTVIELLGKNRAAAEALAAVAGNGVEEMGPAAAALNDSCNACHREYRVEN